MCKPMQSRANESCMPRRNFLKVAAGIGVAAIASAPKLGASAPPALPAQSTSTNLSPADVLRLLADGNQRFVAGSAVGPHRSLARVKELSAKQAPIAAFLGCADSRVPIEIVFYQGFGDLFVARVAGNVIDSAIIGTLEFGTAVLGAKVLYVLGHTGCGAVSAAIKGDEVPGQISTLFQHLRPAVRKANGDVDAAVRENVRIQAGLIAESSPVIARLIRDGKLDVAAGV